MNNLVQNEAISAAAGCGKTEELAVRYIRLLAAGAKPESILALTFTRHAAGEMLGRILERISGAVLYENKRTELLHQLGAKEFGNTDFQVLLKLLIEKLNCLRISTLDSFFVEIVKCFAPELGVDFKLQLTDDFSESVLQTKALEQIYLSARKNKKYFDELKTTFDKLTQQKEESNIERQFLNGISDGYMLFLRTKKEAWTNFPNPEIDTSDENWKKLVEEFEKCEGFNIVKSNINAANFLSKLKNNDFKEIFKSGPVANLLNNKETYYKWQLNEVSTDVLLKIKQFIVSRKLKEIIPATEAYYTFLLDFHKRYSEIKANSAVRTFFDICRLLNVENSLFQDSGKTEMFFRLDTVIKHLLIDEFQDTSWDQWNSISTLADEIICDTSGERSFFIVGDIKQAIFGWRGGDEELFGKIVEHYKGNITEKSLEKSWRSGDNILNPVNLIFNSDNKEIVKWKAKSRFKDHTSAVNKKRPGYTELRHVKPEEDEDKTFAKQKAVISLLKKIKPWNRGLRVALLFRDNKSINDWLPIVKNAGIPCYSEGKSRLLDDSAVQAVLALFRWMDMPEDKLAEFHVTNSFLREKVKTKEELYSLKQFLFYNSYSEFIEKIAEEFKNKTEESTRARLNQLLEIAEQYQPNATSRPAGFISYVEKISQREPAATEGVAFVTMHSSKGMTYDIVILSELEKQLPNSGKLKFLEKIKEFEDELKAPETECLVLNPGSNVAKADELLNSMMSAGVNKLKHEFLNMMYVALTRASKGLYLICSKSKSNDFSAWITDALATPPANVESLENDYNDIPGEILFKMGESLWFEEEFETKELKIEFQKTPKVKLLKKTRRGRLYVTPSSLTSKYAAEFDYSECFLKENRGKEFGAIIHALFASVGWLRENLEKRKDELKFIARRAAATFSEKECDECVEEFLNILDKPEIRKVLSAPVSPCDILLEKPFAAIINNKLVRGVFDRVVFFPNKENPEKINLYDFKTDAVKSEKEISAAIDEYKGQLELYAQALSQAYNLPAKNISKNLIFTSPGQVRTT